MISKHGCWWAILTLGLGLAVPQMATAGPYLGDWGWLWHPCRDCPRGEYSPLHYWTVGLYKARSVVLPSSLDQFAPDIFAPGSDSAVPALLPRIRVVVADDSPQSTRRRGRPG